MAHFTAKIPPKCAISTWKCKKFSAPSPDPSHCGEGIPSPTPTPLGACGASTLAPSALDLALPGCNSWIRLWIRTARTEYRDFGKSCLNRTKTAEWRYRQSEYWVTDIPCWNGSIESVFSSVTDAFSWQMCRNAATTLSSTLCWLFSSVGHEHKQQSCNRSTDYPATTHTLMNNEARVVAAWSHLRPLHIWGAAHTVIY